MVIPNKDACIIKLAVLSSIIRYALFDFFIVRCSVQNEMNTTTFDTKIATSSEIHPALFCIIKKDLRMVMLIGMCCSVLIGYFGTLGTVFVWMCGIVLFGLVHIHINVYGSRQRDVAAFLPVMVTLGLVTCISYYYTTPWPWARSVLRDIFAWCYHCVFR